MADHELSWGNQSRAEREISAPFTNALGIGGICLVMLFINSGDYMEVLPGFERFVAGPVFPFIHESHDIVALALSLYIAHRWTPRVGVIASLWFLALHIPYIIVTFPDELSEGLRSMLMAGAALFGIRIIHLRKLLEKKLAEQVMLDPLTGLLNHVHFYMELEYQLALARRYGVGGSIMFVDLDGFKAVNDHLGHQAGDELLKQVANLLRHQMRAADSVARIGGDEFAAILPRTNIEQAHLAGKRFNMTVRALPVNFPFPVSASIGFAVYPEHGDSAESLLAFADRAMYRAKAEGRYSL